jgi:hypothetical protein
LFLEPDAQRAFGTERVPELANSGRMRERTLHDARTVANELFMTVRGAKIGDCKLLILVRPARLERATSWFVG